jgi:hypothetical protein
VTGTVPGGGEFEMLFEGTGVVRDGKFIRLELLPEGRVSDAVSRLADAAGPAASPRASDGDPPSAFDPLS